MRVIKKNHKISWEEIYAKIECMKQNLIYEDMHFFGMSEVGQVLAGMTGKAVDSIEEADILIDGVYNTGKTFEEYHERFPSKEYCFLYNKELEFKNQKIIFPWQKKETS